MGQGHSRAQLASRDPAAGPSGWSMFSLIASFADASEMCLTAPRWRPCVPPAPLQVARDLWAYSVHSLCPSRQASWEELCLSKSQASHLPIQPLPDCRGDTADPQRTLPSLHSERAAAPAASSRPLDVPWQESNASPQTGSFTCGSLQTLLL